MTINEWSDVILRLIELLTKWQVIILYILLLFRQQFSNLLPALVDRLKRVSVVGNVIEFNEVQKLATTFPAPILRQILLKLRSGTSISGAEESENDTEADDRTTDEVDDVAPSRPEEAEELQRELERLNMQFGGNNK